MSAGNCRHVWRHEEAAPGYFTRRVCLKCGTRQRWGTEPQTDAVREYRDACRAPACSIDREAFNWNRATALLRGRDYLAKYADAAIAELEDKVEELDDKLMEAEGAHENARRWFEAGMHAQLREAEAEARRWEWLAKEASRDRRTPDGPLLDTLLARYEEEGHWTA